MAVAFPFHPLRALLAGFFCSVMGLSAALATQSRQIETQAPLPPRPAGSRAAGTGLSFSNPFLLPGQSGLFPNGGSVSSDPQGFDLGDVLRGSDMVRFLSALRGVTPYYFTSDTIGTTGLSLEPIGRVAGILPASAALPLSFTATLHDAAGTTRTGTFWLNTCAQSSFRFAMDRVPSAQVGQDYITQIETIGADMATTDFSVLDGSVRLNGRALPALETAGLSLTIDGVLSGRTLASGTLEFTAQASKGQARAQNRAGTAFDQAFTLEIAPEQIVQSVFALQNLAIQGGRPGRDTLKLTALINPDGLSQSDFGEQWLVLRFAGALFAVFLNEHGQSRTGDMRVSLDTRRGLLKVTVLRQDLGTFLPVLADRLATDQVVQVRIGSQFLGTEAVRLNVRSRSKNNTFQWNYRFGSSVQLGGLFQITNVRAEDAHHGTAFKINFLISHVQGQGSTSFGTPTEATVFIGPGFSQTVTLRHGRGSFPPDGLAALKIDTRRKTGWLTTYPLPESQTGIPPARHSGGQQQTLILGLDVTTPSVFFSGDASRRIAPFETHY